MKGSKGKKQFNNICTHCETENIKSERRAKSVYLMQKKPNTHIGSPFYSLPLTSLFHTKMPGREGKGGAELYRRGVTGSSGEYQAPIGLALSSHGKPSLI